MERTQVTVKVPRFEAGGTATAAARLAALRSTGRQLGLKPTGTQVEVRNDGR